jgi:hypothetical protein
VTDAFRKGAETDCHTPFVEISVAAPTTPPTWLANISSIPARVRSSRRSDTLGVVVQPTP